MSAVTYFVVLFVNLVLFQWAVNGYAMAAAFTTWEPQTTTTIAPVTTWRPQSASTTDTVTTQEPMSTTHKFQNWSTATFLYEYYHHTFVVKTSTKCYLIDLTQREMQKLRTPSGMADFEIKALEMIGRNAEKPVDFTDGYTLHSYGSYTAHMCQGHTTVELERL